MQADGTSKFERDYETAAWGHVREREKARAYREERADAVSAFWENVGPEERAAMVEVAYEALLPKNVATVHPSQRKLIRLEMWRERCEKYGRPQTNRERLEEGYIWDGRGTEDKNGVKTYLVNGKYLQKPFLFKKLKRDEDEFVMRFVASTPRASSGILMTGMGKDKCHRQNRKLAALDNTHGFFCERVRGMFRIDIQKTWASKEALQADLDKLEFRPQSVVHTWDDRYPDQIIDPHFYHILPEGKGVWNNKKHHKLLNRVIAGLNKMYMPLGCDPGGMSNPYHGKLITSPHNDYFVPAGSYTVDDDGNRVMPSLAEYAKGLDISMGLEKMARHLSRAILSDAGFDAKESNTYFSWPSKAARAAVRDLFKAGADITDEASAIEKVDELVTTAFYAEHEIKTVRSRAAMAKVIRSCSRWAVLHFDPSKMDKAGRDRGAAHHLMAETDDAKIKMQKGQKYSAEVKIAATRHKMTTAMIPIIRAGKEPTVADMMETTGFCRNTCKRHLFAAYVAAIATLSLQDLVKGVHPLPATIHPSSILQLATKRSDIPDSWQQQAVSIDWREEQLRSTRATRRSGNRSACNDPPPAGRNTLNFLSGGFVKRFASSSGRQRTA